MSHNDLLGKHPTPWTIQIVALGIIKHKASVKDVKGNNIFGVIDYTHNLKLLVDLINSYPKEVKNESGKSE